MKVALCLSGQIRSFDLVYQKLLDNLINPNECDVFCHTWHMYDNSKYTNFYNPSDNKHISYGSYSYENIEKVIKHLRPVSFSFDNPFIEENTKSMFYSLMKSNSLKCDYENLMGFKYDIVIRCRTDIIFPDKIILDNNIDDSIIYLSYRPGGCGGVNESFAYGRSVVMDEYSNIYRRYENTSRICQPCPEGIIFDFLRETNIKIKNPPFSYFIVREDGYKIGLNPFNESVYGDLGLVLADNI